jgi:ADP-ribose pyrophosphatase YjhB (NUDIX family)
MAKSDRSNDAQYAALPYRMSAHGPQVMLITSRETRRWVIPKGWPMEGKKPHRVAELEAFQEAGIKGIVSKKPIGTYPYAKALAGGGERLCFVEVFLLRVTVEAANWPEKAERRRAWFKPEEAADKVDEVSLARIIEDVALDVA